jgi:2-polyprenyl-3-methyl-5-hydroxy-6-metoxy-1,4-benzoquinol methylase
MSHCVKIFNIDYLTCDHCGHVFYQQIVKSEIIDDLYDGETEYLEEYVDNKLYKERIEQIAKPKAAYLSEMILHDQDAEWLDIGCGGCDMLYALRENGWKVRGIEPGIAGVQLGRSLGIDVKQVFFTPEKASEHIGNAHVVSLFNVIEHVFDPVAMICSVAENMKPGTFLVLEVPRHPSLSSLACILHPQMAARHIVAPEHLHIFTEQSMNLLLEKARLNLTHVWRFGQDFYEIMGLLTMLANKEADIWPKELFGAFNDIQTVVDEHGLSDCLMIIAEKREP